MITSKITYSAGLTTTAEHIRSGKTIQTDAPIDNNGKGEAFSPTDLAATSLGNCAMTIIGIAAEKEGLDFTGSTVDITKIMSAEAPRRIAEIKVAFSFRVSQNLNESQKQRFERLAHTCPVALSLHPDLVQNMVFEWS